VPVARFCPACGERLLSAPPTTCTACGTQHWRNAKPGAAAVVSRSGRVLLARRAHDPWRGHWCLPSGFCELDEHPIDAAERETWEEAGVRVCVTGYIGIWIKPYADEPRLESDRAFVVYYHARPTGEQGVPDPREISEVGWFDPDELPEELAPPEVLPAVLAAWAADVHAGRTESPLPDRQR
jgi:ADP-ribose pyrophosphatase YjhB (NUDIX family)